MEIFGIGPWELVVILLVILIVLGPKEMISDARKLANWIRKLRESELFKTTKEIAEMPKQIMKETGLQDEINQIRDVSSKTIDDTIRQTLYTPIDNLDGIPPKNMREKKQLRRWKRKRPSGSLKTLKISPEDNEN